MGVFQSPYLCCFVIAPSACVCLLFQLELRALTEVTKRPIQVFSASAPVTEMGAQFAGNDATPLRVSYHEQYYALGEHYNSVV